MIFIDKQNQWCVRVYRVWLLRVNRIAFALVAFVALTAQSSESRAERRPIILSDGFYVGVRAEPGWALSGAWDLDVYPVADRVVSLGPSVAVNVLSTDPNPLRRQDVMVSVDVLQLKVGLNHPGGFFRPFVLVGGGFSWLRWTVPEAPLVRAVDEGFLGLLTVGVGADIWGTSRFGVTILNHTRVRLTGSDRVPLVWAEFFVGVRVGL